MEEIYKDIEGFDKYEISNLGNVRNKKTGLILKPVISSNGYYTIGLWKNGKRTTKKIHRLIAEAFIPNPENKPKVDHIDNNKQNNNTVNLRWVTSKENNQNSQIYKNNKSGAKGVYYNKQANKWISQIQIDGIIIHIGSFKTLEEAKQARIQKANQVFGVYTNACEKCNTRKTMMKVINK